MGISICSNSARRLIPRGIIALIIANWCVIRARRSSRYAHFGWPVSDRMRGRLKEATRRQGEFKSQHEYTLEEFGLSKEWIQAELGEVLDFYKLER